MHPVIVVKHAVNHSLPKPPDATAEFGLYLILFPCLYLFPLELEGYFIHLQVITAIRLHWGPGIPPRWSLENTCSLRAIILQVLQNYLLPGVFLNWLADKTILYRNKQTNKSTTSLFIYFLLKWNTLNFNKGVYYYIFTLKSPKAKPEILQENLSISNVLYSGPGSLFMLIAGGFGGFLVK